MIENLAMLAYIDGWTGFSGWPAVAGFMATLKFLLVAVAIVYILMGVVAAVIGRLSEKRTS